MSAPLCECAVCRRLRGTADSNGMGFGASQNVGYSAHFTIRQNMIVGPCESISNRPNSGKDVCSISNAKGDSGTGAHHDKRNHFTDANGRCLYIAYITEDIIWSGDGREI